MQSQKIPRAVAAAAVIFAGGLVWVARAPRDESLVVRPDANVPPQLARDVAAGNDPPAPLPETLAAAKLRELEAMSETFRNTTFLIAIRDAGFVCNELLRVYGGVNDSATWTATCSEMLAYTVSIGSAGTLRVEPTMQYWDGVTPALPRDPGGEVVPPQTR